MTRFISERAWERLPASCPRGIAKGVWALWLLGMINAKIKYYKILYYAIQT